MPRQRSEADPAFLFAQLTRGEQQAVLDVFSAAMAWGPSDGVEYVRSDGGDRFRVGTTEQHNLVVAVAEAHTDIREESIAMLVRK